MATRFLVRMQGNGVRGDPYTVRLPRFTVIDDVLIGPVRCAVVELPNIDFPDRLLDHCIVRNYPQYGDVVVRIDAIGRAALLHWLNERYQEHANEYDIDGTE